MAEDPITANAAQPGSESRASWMPLVVIVMGQILMVFNVATLQVSIEGISSSLNVPATHIGTAIVTYALCVAGLILLGARIVQIFGSRRVFRATVVLFAAAMAVMAASFNMAVVIAAQVIAGTAAAALVPTLVVLLAESYSGAQQAKALGWLGAAAAMGIVLAFLVAGVLGALLGWRFTFGLLVLFAAGILYLSRHLAESPAQAGVQIDALGIVLAAGAVFLVSMGADNLTEWGVLLATPRAPFSLLDVSPAPVMMLVGIFLGQAFISWSRRREAAGRAPLVALEVVDTAEERAALFSIFAISAFGSAITFLIPLYVQVVGLEITGTAIHPVSETFSDPPMSDSELLTQLMMGQSLPDAFGEDDALERLARNIGLQHMLLALERLRTGIGLDELGMDRAGGGNGVLVAGERIGSDLLLCYRHGLFDDFTGLELIYGISDRFRLHTKSGSGQSIDLVYEVGPLDAPRPGCRGRDALVR